MSKTDREDADSGGGNSSDDDGADGSDVFDTKCGDYTDDSD